MSPTLYDPKQCPQFCPVPSSAPNPALSSAVSCPRGSHIRVLSCPCPVSPQVSPALSLCCPQRCHCPCAPSVAVPKPVLSPSVSLSPPPIGRVSSGDAGRGQRSPQPWTGANWEHWGERGAAGAAWGVVPPPPRHPPNVPPGPPRGSRPRRNQGDAGRLPAILGWEPQKCSAERARAARPGDSDGRGDRGGSPGTGGGHPGHLGGLRAVEGSLAAWGEGFQDNLRWCQGLGDTWAPPDLHGGVFGQPEGGSGPRCRPAAAAATALMWLRHRSAMGATWRGGTRGGHTRTGGQAWGARGAGATPVPPGPPLSPLGPSLSPRALSRPPPRLGARVPPAPRAPAVISRDNSRDN